MTFENNNHAAEIVSGAAGAVGVCVPESGPTRKVQLLNVVVDDITMDELLARFDRGTICTIHSDMLMWLQKDREFYEQSIAADFITCDSQILTFATRVLGTPLKQRLSGSDLLPRFYKYHRDNPEITLFLLGGLGDVAQKARDLINQKVGREIVVGAFSPAVGTEKSEAACQAMVDKVNTAPPRAASVL